MVLYARNDIQAQTCYAGGPSHRRPQKGNGEPVPVWGISCPECEAALNPDPRWSPSRYRIPLTPDEAEQAKEAKELAQAAMNQQQILVAQKMAEASMTQRGAVPEIDPTDVAITGPEAADVAPGDADGQPDLAARVAAAKASYVALSKAELAGLARDRGLATGGTKDDLATRNAEHEVKTSA
jgi:hypothetical protein